MLLVASEAGQKRERRSLCTGQECVQGCLDEAVGSDVPAEGLCLHEQPQPVESFVLGHVCRVSAPLMSDVDVKGPQP